MTLGGWITMFISVGTVVCLFGYCLKRVFSDPSPVDKMHGMDIDTQD